MYPWFFVFPDIVNPFLSIASLITEIFKNFNASSIVSFCYLDPFTFFLSTIPRYTPFFFFFHIHFP